MWELIIPAIASVITTLLSVGGLGWIFTIREDKKAKKIENEKAKAEVEDYKHDQVIQSYKDVLDMKNSEINHLYEMNADLSAKCAEKDSELQRLNEKISNQNDLLGKLQMVKCLKTKCLDREPPYGYDLMGSQFSVKEGMEK